MSQTAQPALPAHSLAQTLLSAASALPEDQRAIFKEIFVSGRPRQEVLLNPVNSNAYFQMIRSLKAACGSSSAVAA